VKEHHVTGSVVTKRPTYHNLTMVVVTVTCSCGATVTAEAQKISRADRLVKSKYKAHKRD
jgi:hypothetical protein